MKIFGIGTDIVSIARIKKSIKNKRFVSRVYNVKEIEEFNIGHFLIGESIFEGMGSVIKTFKKILKS